MYAWMYVHTCVCTYIPIYGVLISPPVIFAMCLHRQFFGYLTWEAHKYSPIRIYVCVYVYMYVHTYITDSTSDISAWHAQTSKVSFCSIINKHTHTNTNTHTHTHPHAHTVHKIQKDASISMARWCLYLHSGRQRFAKPYIKISRWSKLLAETRYLHI